MSHGRIIGKRSYDSMLTESPTQYPVDPSTITTTTNGIINHSNTTSSHPSSLSTSCAQEAGADNNSTNGLLLSAATPTNGDMTSPHLERPFFTTSKRARQSSSGDQATSTPSHTAPPSHPLGQALSPIRSTELSPFVAHPIEVESNHIHHTSPTSITNPHKRRLLQSSGHQTHSSPISTTGEPMYTESQVKRILSDALRRQQEQLRAEYDQTLQQLLREQFDSFSSFNRDYVSRQLRNSDFSYLS